MIQTPRLKAPANACDVHMHIIYPEQQLPFAPENPGKFPPFPAADYMRVAKDLGITRSVVVVTPAYV
jgi:D-galactarolactone isomerase